MFKYILKLIEIHKEIHSAISVLRSENENECIDECLTSLECRKLGIERGGYISSLLGYYKKNI